MDHRAVKPFIFLAIFVLMVSLACLGSSAEPTQAPAAVEPTSEPTSEPIVEPTATVPPTEAPTDTPEPQVDPLLVTTLGDVEKAVIQIEAEGTFIDPEVGWNVNVGKTGSGVIIDPQGIAITNNHVVTGNALLRIWVGGDTSRTYNAKVLGVSECSDLAVIDIDGDGFPYVQWFEGSITVGQEVYAAGFPLGDPQYTLTDGIVSKAAADGETSWASVDEVIEHTAKINPGNSGGPLVDANGNLLGINYSGVSDTDQNYAISRDEAVQLINQLRQGIDIDSIGINGGAVYGTINDQTISGVWVRSVSSGSPASLAGILPGDIVYQLENEVLATDGTMADYCDILRSRNIDDMMTVTVIRWTDLSLWEGSVNGEEIDLVGYFAEGSSESSGGDESSDTSTIPDNCDNSETAGYLSCIDDKAMILLDIPDTWLDFNGSEWIYDEEIIGVAISASPDLAAFDSSNTIPGVFFGASDTFAQWGGYVQFLDVYTEWYKGVCDFDGRYDYDDGLYKGKMDYYSNCDGAGGGDAYVLAAVPIGAETSVMIVIAIQLPDGEDAVLEHMLNSFYTGDF